LIGAVGVIWLNTIVSVHMINLPENNWIPLSEIVGIIHHPNFYWGASDGFTDCKYLELRIDTRDNYCQVRNNKRNFVDVAKLKLALKNPSINNMNNNPQLILVPKP
jgi:hypothetical protein